MLLIAIVRIETLRPVSVLQAGIEKQVTPVLLHDPQSIQETIDISGCNNDHGCQHPFRRIFLTENPQFLTFKERANGIRLSLKVLLYF